MFVFFRDASSSSSTAMNVIGEDNVERNGFILGEGGWGNGLGRLLGICVG